MIYKPLRIWILIYIDCISADLIPIDLIPIDLIPIDSIILRGYMLLACHTATTLRRRKKVFGLRTPGQ